MHQHIPLDDRSTRLPSGRSTTVWSPTDDRPTTGNPAGDGPTTAGGWI